MRIALGQFNATVGDLAGNIEKMRDIHARSIAEDVDLLVFPELAVCGYPPEDLLLKKHFCEDSFSAVKKLAADCPEKTIIVGFAESNGKNCYNSAAVLQNGKINDIYHKVLLPNFGIFDEKRYFTEGTSPLMIKIENINIAITICRDLWATNWLGNFLKDSGKIDLIVNLSASPFYITKIEKRKAIIQNCAKNLNCAVAYCNLVGGQDEIVFDGRSMLTNASGNIAAIAKAFEEDLLIADMTFDGEKNLHITPSGPPAVQPIDEINEIYQALVLGTKDYIKKNGFKKVLLGLSGGIDSSVVCAIATDAVGKENVTGVTMPTRFNSHETIADAKKTAENLGIEFLTIPIENMLENFNTCLSAVEGWNSETTAYENLQARIRGVILMSLSNQLGSLVLTSGNKSENAVGYATLYGDNAGGFSVIKDIPKTIVYKLASHINKISNRQIIPSDVINRAPTAELRAGQKDSDSLPDYEILDRILKAYVEENKSQQQLVKSGLDEDLVHKIICMVDRNEYKRRLSPPGVKITAKEFGKGRRQPITNQYNSYNDL